MEKKDALSIAVETYNEILDTMRRRIADAEKEGKKYYTPFAVAGEAAEMLMRQGQIDIEEQSLSQVLDGADRLAKLVNIRYCSWENGVVTVTFAWLHGGVMFTVHPLGMYPARITEPVYPVLAYYNKNCDYFWHFTENAYCPTKWRMENLLNSTFDYTALFDHGGSSYFSNKAFGVGPRVLGHLAGLGVIAKQRPFYDPTIILLWEELYWLKKDIKKLKANIRVAKRPTLLNAKKAELKKVKIDWSFFRHFPIEIRWRKYKHRPVWLLIQEVKRLKKDPRARERIDYLEEPKEIKDPHRVLYKARRWHTYPYMFDKERVPLKSVEEYKEEIRRLKELKKRLKKLYRERIRAENEKAVKWLREVFRPTKRALKRIDRTPRMRELRRRWRARRRWILNTALKYGIDCLPYFNEGAFRDKPEIQKVLEELYIPTIEHPELGEERRFIEYENFQERRGCPGRENMLGHLFLRRWRRIDLARLLPTEKAFGLGRVTWPGALSELLCPESRGRYRFNFPNAQVFKAPIPVWGMGEWKELTRFVRQHIPYPLQYRLIRDEYGYPIMEQDYDYAYRGRWECRPIHPAHAFLTNSNELGVRLWTYIGWLLSHLMMKRRWCGWVSTAIGGYMYWPTDRLTLPHSRVSRLTQACYLYGVFNV